jgi:uncharacterized protein (TIGR02145 family)
MMRVKILLLVVINLMFINLTPKAQAVSGTDTAVTTLKSGNWSDASVWSNLKVPDITDSIVLMHNVIIDITAFCKAINLNGKSLTVKEGINFTIDGVTPLINPLARIIDSSKLKLLSTAGELSNGTYRYQVISTIPPFVAGNIITGPDNDGYLRRVTHVQTTPNEVTLTTVQASMDEVFKQAKFGFPFNISDLAEVPNQGGETLKNVTLQEADSYTFPLPQKTLLDGDLARIELTGGTVTVAPNFHFDYDFGLLSGLKSFEMNCDNAKIDGVLNFSIYGNACNLERSDTIIRRGKTVRVLVYGFPVYMKLDFFLIANTSFSYVEENSYQKNITVNTSNTFSTGIKYNNGIWDNNFSLGNSDYTVGEIVDVATKPKMEAKVAFRPLFKIRFYGVLAPYFFSDLALSLTGQITRPSNSWDLKFGAWLEGGIGAQVQIFTKKPIIDINKKWSTDTLTLKTPYILKEVSGNFQQSEDTANYLPKPIKIQVLDELDSSQSNVPVFFKLLQKGKLSIDTVLTDGGGFAETQWKTDTAKVQFLEVSVKDGVGANINGSPLKFTANFAQPCGNIPDSTFTDPRDGQVYTYQRIGTQVWMTKNLNYGTVGYCYGNDAANCAIYGRLYNWNNARAVAPPGWHLPSDAEWTTLINFLGGASIAGGAMKTTTLWNAPNTGATNCSGFSGVPGGNRTLSGVFGNIGTNGSYWSSTETTGSPTFARIYDLYSNSTFAGRVSNVKSGFLSVRCVRD